MKNWYTYFALLALVLLGGTGCATVGGLSKAPITPLHSGGTVAERRQEYALKQVKWFHEGGHGKILGARKFSDGKRPITGARRKDTLEILSGPQKGSYTITRVIRQRQGKKRRVMLEIDGKFKIGWSVLTRGNGGTVLGKYLFTDVLSFLPDASPGARVVVTTPTGPVEYVVKGTKVVQVPGTRNTRLAYVVETPFPSKARGLRYAVKAPKKHKAVKYRIRWRGSSLSGYAFTIGIARRRYSQPEMSDLLRTEPGGQARLKSQRIKRSAAVVLRAVGVVSLLIGGYFALVARDEVDPAVSWSITGGGALLWGISIPIGISANRDYLAAAGAYNTSLKQKLRLGSGGKPAKGKKTSRVTTIPGFRVSLKF